MIALISALLPAPLFTYALTAILSVNTNAGESYQRKRERAMTNRVINYLSCTADEQSHLPAADTVAKATALMDPREAPYLPIVICAF